MVLKCPLVFSQVILFIISEVSCTIFFPSNIIMLLGDTSMDFSLPTWMGVSGKLSGRFVSITILHSISGGRRGRAKLCSSQ